MATEDVDDYAIVPDDDYVASTYVPPKVFLNVANSVERIVVGRDVDESSNSILAFVSGDREEQIEYVEGLVGIGTFLTVMILIWFLVLILLKFQGRERMGCAAGYAFHDTDSDKPLGGEDAEGADGGGDGDGSEGAAVDSDDSVAKDDEPKNRKSSEDKPSKFSSMFSSGFSFGKRESAESETKPEDKPESSVQDSANAAEENDLHLELDNIVQSATQQSESNGKEGEPMSLKSLPKAVEIGDEGAGSGDESNDDDAAIEKTWGKTCLCSPEPEHVQRRKFHTRAVFALVSVLSLLCCLLLITNMYRPLESAALTTREVVKDAAGIADDLNEALDIVDEATLATIEMMQNTPTEFPLICPDLPPRDFENQFGFDAEELIGTVSTEFQSYVPQITELLSQAQATGDSVTEILVDVDAAMGTANEYLWLIPLVICVTLLIIFSQLALMLAVVYREEKFKGMKTKIPQVENCYGWTVLPLQIFVIVISWVFVIVFCFGAVITTDTCLPNLSETGINNGRGTPDDVVLAVISEYVKAPETDNVAVELAIDNVVVDLAKERLAMYITGCGEMPGPGSRRLREDPLAELIVIQDVLRDSIKEVETNLSFVNDVLGIQFIEDGCGPGNQIRPYFRNLRVLSRKFSNLSRALKLSYDALSCPRINSLYVKTVHDAFCTDFATANSNGLILFLILSFSGMIMITLRASWRSAE